MGCFSYATGSLMRSPVGISGTMSCRAPHRASIMLGAFFVLGCVLRVFGGGVEW